MEVLRGRKGKSGTQAAGFFKDTAVEWMSTRFGHGKVHTKRNPSSASFDLVLWTHLY